AAAAVPGPAMLLGRLIRLVGRRFLSLRQPVHDAEMAAAHGAGELVVPCARIFQAVQRGRRLPPHPEIRMPPAVEAGFMRPGRRAVPDDLGFATLVVSSYHAPDRCQSHGLPFLL